MKQTDRKMERMEKEACDSEPRRSYEQVTGGVGDDGKIKIIDKLQGLSQVRVGRAMNFR